MIVLLLLCSYILVALVVGQYLLPLADEDDHRKVDLALVFMASAWWPVTFALVCIAVIWDWYIRE